jgi:hypothetical protein
MTPSTLRSALQPAIVATLSKGARPQPQPHRAVFCLLRLPQYADWGIDFIKLDCAFAVNAVLEDVRGVSDGIFSSGREMLLSLSPGKWATPEQVEAVRGLANMYRITDDAWDDWSHLQVSAELRQADCERDGRDDTH